jgi:DNA-binding GntR family transcriptional regulator
VSDHLPIIIDRSSAVPLYFQVAQQLEAAIAEGRLEKGEFLSNEIELAARWKISRPTVRQAIKQLVDDGLLVRRRGVGTQVVSDELRRPGRLTSLYDDLTAAGRNPTTEVLTLERVGADLATAEALGIPAASEVVHIERCRIGGSKRLAIMRNWLTVESAGTITIAQLRETGLYQLIRAQGVQPHSAHQIIGAMAATPTDAALLGLPAGAPLLTMRRVMQDSTGRTVEVGRHVYDATQYSVEMTVLEN